MTSIATDGSSPLHDPFVQWNLQLLNSFFSPASKGEEVWIQIDAAELDSLAPDLGGDEGFLKAVRAGPPWGTIRRNGTFVVGESTDLVARASGLVEQRTNPSRRPRSYLDPGDVSPLYARRRAPTYLPILAALVRSARLAEDGFYAHLREAIGLSASWGTQQMVALEPLWADLQRWTGETEFDFGRFVFRTLGGYSRIGVPRSQSIMSKRDSELLPRIFAQVGLRPNQRLSDPVVEAIRIRSLDSPFLSHCFTDALANDAFTETVDARLRALFDEWDGTVPRFGRQGGEAGAEEGFEDGRESVELCLTLQEDGEFPWQIRWRVPALREAGSLVLKHGEHRWTAPLVGTEPCTTLASGEETLRAASESLLSLSARDEVVFRAELAQEGERTSELGELSLRQAVLRTLVWGYNELSGTHELRERALPLNGPAYLLAVPENAERLRAYLAREQLAHDLIDSSGLPPGWTLICLSDCGSLSEEQRATLPDGESERSRPRTIRLVGGRSVSRGGIRQYMSYDLPVVEVDAPLDARLHAPGLRFDPEVIDGDVRSAIRRFRITRESDGPRSFTIVAKRGSDQLGTARLRIAADGGDQFESGGDFSLDWKGTPRRDAKGLRGLLPATPASALGTGTLPNFRARVGDLGKQAVPGEGNALASDGAMQFLDTLVQVGSIGYGSARDQLARLLARQGTFVSPALALLDLRSRGHVEIETDQKGHLTRVFAVQPALYELPAHVDGRRILGVLGSLRLGQWRALSEGGADWTTYLTTASGIGAPSMRIVETNHGALLSRLAEYNLPLRAAPSPDIIGWAASSNDVVDDIVNFAGESLGQAVHATERFNPQKAWFFPVAGAPQVLTGASRFQLFRMEDLDTGRLRVHALGVASTGRPPSYSFVRDSRWGVWIALGAFATFVRDTYGIHDASPWPIPYEPTTGTVWLPARISLPVVLERALVLCSGARPSMTEADSLGSGERVVLTRRSDGASLGGISRVYGEMATGKWLAYRWVSRRIAETVAGKVGGALMDL